MPTIDNEARRREFNRTLALSRKRGDFITCDAASAPATMVIDGKPVTMRPQLSQIDIEAAKKREWEREFERKYLSYW